MNLPSKNLKNIYFLNSLKIEYDTLQEKTKILNIINL